MVTILHAAAVADPPDDPKFWYHVQLIATPTGYMSVAQSTATTDTQHVLRETQLCPSDSPYKIALSAYNRYLQRYKGAPWPVRFNWHPPHFAEAFLLGLPRYAAGIDLLEHDEQRDAFIATHTTLTIADPTAPKREAAKGKHLAVRIEHTIFGGPLSSDLHVLSHDRPPIFRLEKNGGIVLSAAKTPADAATARRAALELGGSFVVDGYCDLDRFIVTRIVSGLSDRDALNIRPTVVAFIGYDTSREAKIAALARALTGLVPGVTFVNGQDLNQTFSFTTGEIAAAIPHFSDDLRNDITAACGPHPAVDFAIPA